MTTAVEMEPKKPRYNGFTCPNCGSHMFGTVMKWYQSRMGTKWPEGAAIGHCNEYTYRNVNCRYEWNRADLQAESVAMYHMTEQDWQESFVAIRALIEETVVIVPGQDEILAWGRGGAALRAYMSDDRHCRTHWRVYPEDGPFFYAIIDNFGDLVKIP